MVILDSVVAENGPNEVYQGITQRDEGRNKKQYLTLSRFSNEMKIRLFNRTVSSESTVFCDLRTQCLFSPY